MQVQVFRRRSRVALHLTAVAGLVTGTVLLTSAPGHASGSARPDSYGGDAAASGIHVTADRNPQPTPVTDLVHVELPFATSSLDSSGNASAMASQLYPGGGPLGAPGLLCQAGVPCGSFPPLPGYPLMTAASYPTMPDAKEDASPGVLAAGPLATAPNLAVAHADPDRVESTTKATGVEISGVLSADTVTTHSKQVFEGSTLVVLAESTVTGLDLGNGALHIDAVRSVAISRVDGGEVTTSSAITTVAGATAGGTPVSIDSTGVHLAGQGDGGQALGGVNTGLAALDASGLAVRLTTATRSAQNGAASAVTGGLLVTFDRTADLPPVPGAPSPNGEYVGSLTVAGAGAAAFASPSSDLGLPDVELPPVGGPLPATDVTTPVQGAVGAVLSGQPAASTTGSSAPPAVAVGPTRTHPLGALGVDLTHERLRLLALVLLAYPALVLVTAPVRLRPRKRTALSHR